MNSLEEMSMKIRRQFIKTLMVMSIIISGCSSSALGSNEEPITTEGENNYVIVDTAQTNAYDNDGNIIQPTVGDAFYGQDANYCAHEPSYTDNEDGTITDNNTGLMWQKDAEKKQTYNEAQEAANSCTLGGYTDWRVPTIKELYSLINFNGSTGRDANSTVPYIDDAYFIFYTGDENQGERFIDAQYMSSTKYVSTTMRNDETVFGVNFVDGRIKGYPVVNPRSKQDNEYYTIYVRGNNEYGENNFIDNGDGTITDAATGLMWMQLDSGSFDNGEDGAMTWQEALEWAENLEYAGYDDWKLPDAKELQSIVDYSRSPATTHSAAIDPVFSCTQIMVEDGSEDYPFYWSSTTHLDGKRAGSSAVYVAFGEALGIMNNQTMDVHGAGAQRSDPKSGDPRDYEGGFGPQGDVRRIYNYVRLVRESNSKVSNVTNSRDVNEQETDNPMTIEKESYTLMSPLKSTNTFLMDSEGNTVFTWESNYRPGNASYLLDNGHLLRTANVKSKAFNAGGAGGRLEEFDGEGNLIWEYEYASNDDLAHHDIEVLPNGNILIIAWEKITKQESLSMGRKPNLVKDSLWVDHIIEVKPYENKGGEIVWEWHLLDHLVQDYDAKQDNYGDISKNPQLVNFNYTPYPNKKSGLDDWTHINAIDYNEELDQILLSVHGLNEIWIIDHNTTTQEASGEKGDLLYRFGNPEAYEAGEKKDCMLFGQHDAKWINNGNILVYNNGTNRGGRGISYSTVDEIKVSLDNGSYTLENQPSQIVWTYGEVQEKMYSKSISGAQRLPNGNTQICIGESGKILEVTRDGQIAWEYDYGEAIFRAEKYFLK